MVKNRKNSLRKAGILSIALLVAVNAIISGSLILMKDDLGISLASAEFLVTLSSITTVIFIFLSEYVTRLIGIKKCVNLGLFLVAISAFLPIISKTYIAVFLSRLILGAGVGLYNSHSVNLINIFYKGDKASYLHGVRNSMEYVGQMLLLLLAGLLIKASWNLSFLAYASSIIILIFFNMNVEDVDVEISDAKFTINIQTIFYIVFSGIMIMNSTAITIRFPYVASLALGENANINIYMLILPISGMISGFFFGIINRRLRAKTILTGLIIYIFVNILVGIFGENIYVYMISMAILAFAQSLCFPYLFAEIARFVRSSSARIVNNLIFMGCNIGGFLASLYLNTITGLFSIKSPTLAFVSFSMFYVILFAIFFYEYLSVRSYRVKD